MGKCFMIIKFTLNNTFIFLQQCQFILHSSVHSCFSQIPLNENTISFPWDITNSGLSRRFLTSSLKIEAICGLTGHFQPRGLNDASIREIVSFQFLRHFVIRPGTSVSLDKITTSIISTGFTIFLIFPSKTFLEVTNSYCRGFSRPQPFGLCDIGNPEG